MREIFRGNDYRVVFSEPNERRDKFVITFMAWSKETGLDRVPAASKFIEYLGYGFVGIVPRTNCWYQLDEIEQVLAVVREAIPGGYEVVAYSSSMGAYASLNFAEALNVTRGLVVSPQYSLDPKVIDFEKRWYQEARQIEFKRDYIKSRDSDLNFSILLDGRLKVDIRHAELIAQRFHKAKFYSIEGAEHDPFGYLSRKNLLKPLIAEYLSKGTIMRHEQIPMVEMDMRMGESS
ncbi:hypothetical protein [Oceanicella sp. SM1341]|uniref:hypothetical protein n=1 Tax=Oceanicella sp. SM1341 TaxID=1548889 RepID=UPI0013008D85|nr:hypothetical protein [Oceanicella sp. SM1341]